MSEMTKIISREYEKLSKANFGIAFFVIFMVLKENSMSASIYKSVKV